MSAVVTGLLFALVGCQTLHYYQQAIVGQGSLLIQREEVANLLANPEIDAKLRQRLMLVGEVVAFAEDNGLPAAGSYDTYVETGKPYIVWNVFAAPPYELTLETSCFPIAGCVSYRGFFNRDDALEHARALREEGFETYVGGVAAYSTLGWPVST